MMYSAAIDIKPINFDKDKDYLDLFSGLLGCLRKNGQILGREYSITKAGKILTSYVNYLSIESPLSCGNCFGFIPLYEIPKTYDDEYHDIICWESDYQACDQLQMNCAVGERFAINQMSKIDSALNKIGIGICRSISEKCKIQVYYYLYKGTGKSRKNEEKRVCPSCEINGCWKNHITVFLILNAINAVFFQILLGI